MAERIIVIGCGAAGATAALQARKFNRKASITIIDSEPYSQYSRCGLPYTISGKVKSLEDLVLTPPKNWATLKIDAKLGTKVTNIDHDNRELFYSGDAGAGSIEYDSLVFATGARNVDPPIKGLDKKRVYRLRTIDDARALASETNRAKTAVVIGGGLIGMEVAEAFHERGLQVTVIEFLPNILLAMIDPELATIVENHCKEHGLTILTNTAAKEIVGDDSPTAVLAQNRVDNETYEIPADFVVVATGVRPVTDLAENIGVQIGATRGIMTNEYMMTNIEGVYACGDCAESFDFVTRRTVVSGLGTVAVRQARVAGINAAGGDVKFPGVVGAKVTKLFGLEIASTGLTDQLAKKYEIDVVRGSIRGSTKPPYFQGGREIKVKTLFNKHTGEIVGGQTIGEEDAAMRINVLTLAIQQGLNPHELFNWENCYAPAICDTWDPIVLSVDAASRRLRR